MPAVLELKPISDAYIGIEGRTAPTPVYNVSWADSKSTSGHHRCPLAVSSALDDARRPQWRSGSHFRCKAVILPLSTRVEAGYRWEKAGGVEKALVKVPMQRIYAAESFTVAIACDADRNHSINIPYHPITQRIHKGAAGVLNCTNSAFNHSMVVGAVARHIVYIISKFTRLKAEESW